MNLNSRVRLKSITEEDLSQLFEWRNQKTIRDVMINSDLITWDQHVLWFSKYKENKNATTKIFYFDNIPYGVLNVQSIDYSNQRCEWGFYIGELSAPKGMGTLLGYTSLNYIFEDLGIRKITAEVLSYNIKSINFHEKLGFVSEGNLRNHILKNNNFVNLLLYGIFEEEWLHKKQVLKESIEGRLL